MSDAHDISDETLARAMRSLGLGGEAKSHPHGPCRYEAIPGYGEWHVLRVRGTGFQERREPVKIVPTRADAEHFIKMLEKADREARA